MAERLQKIVGTDAKMVARVGTWLRRQGEKLPHEDTLKKFVKLFRLKRRAAASLTPQEEQWLAKHDQGMEATPGFSEGTRGQTKNDHGRQADARVRA